MYKCDRFSGSRLGDGVWSARCLLGINNQKKGEEARLGRAQRTVIDPTSSANPTQMGTLDQIVPVTVTLFWVQC